MIRKVFMAAIKNKWEYAVGIIKVDGLEPTDEFKELIKKEKKGQISIDEMKFLLDKRYKMKK